ncbi:hypothetical protein NM208_g2108 [Fusarium decemcellulare]|uniref:Uncharacterized protein n=2 Tax=Fusarium decemcellulare TaxID=57161 RepID=A0ACC1SB75_9HYPO|nr:hypothetical protein NM208_g6949 [Fusarium decemcellulare]KAJ3546213.1 hypothetical protein NM208_g2108 [Fusarium decemcellulare]
MIKQFGIASDPSKISIYAGLITASFTLAELLSGAFWGRLSDRIGRRPVLLGGLSGTALSALFFGFASNFPMALFARAAGGLLNGNSGVLQTMVAELVTVEQHQPRAYTVMPMVWCLGTIIGPAVGGALARPCLNYPEIFAVGSIWDRYPFLLPNLFSATIALGGTIIGFLFLEETHALKKPNPDFFDSGLSVENEMLPAYEIQEGSSNIEPRTHTRSPERRPSEPNTQQYPKTFVKQVIINIISYGILAFHTMTFDQLFPLFLITPQPQHPIHNLPFRFSGGFGLNTKTVGIIMSVQGLYALICNYLFVAPATRRLGPLQLFRALAFTYFLLYFVTPYLVLLPETLRMPGICLVVVWKCTFSTMAYPSNAILLANSAPSKQVLGTINGVTASTASLSRALGPLVSGFLYSFGLRTGYSGLAWWFAGLVTLIGAYLSSRMSEGVRGKVNTAQEEDPLLGKVCLQCADVRCYRGGHVNRRIHPSRSFLFDTPTSTSWQDRHSMFTTSHHHPLKHIMATSNSTADDRRTRRLNYVEAVVSGRQLTTDLAASVLPINHHPPLAAHYHASYGEFMQTRAKPITKSTNQILRSHNVDTNRMSYCEIYSNNRHQNHVTLTQSDSHSGILRVIEMERKHDETAYNLQLPMSELIWQSYMEETRTEQLPASSLRIIWVDTVIEPRTQAVV